MKALGSCGPRISGDPALGTTALDRERGDISERSLGKDAVAFSSALTCLSQLGRGTSANERTEGGAEVGGAELYKVCVSGFGRSV